MDFSDPAQRAAFFAIHSDLPREGPGHRACTARALDLVRRTRPDDPRQVLDLGCGPGAQTLDLAALLPQAELLALDLHAPFVAQLNAAAAAAGLSERVRGAVGDMGQPPVAPGSQDLIWCEGAAYFLGLVEALQRWRPLLAEGGAIALSDAVFTTDERPAELTAFWQAEYPAIGTVAQTRARVEQAGFRLVGDFLLPAEAWWAYYRPIEQRLARLRAQQPDAVLLQAIEENEEEVGFYRRFGDFYSYLFLVVQPR